ncbi:ATP-grasp domain-containing protein [Hyperthermus butylicus]|uniref:Glutathione synthase-RimK/ribosomal protein S6 modification (Glutaminyl transferase) n=1 Tax=Hyperthermus butylicus (strain DSM 5456 / JCM 9403 / PLM1-5) TaxID=415426 RepID=A2BIU1_HYPBU|nr:RimK family alpha-L-glutamate ligase [Hyperthermus butylicus]ABM79897.1 glutathione synthase-RimK/ribosomal protein S6 modification (glutaminyl transferase) [Hyperthermus butylicus DSM 5456]
MAKIAVLHHTPRPTWSSRQLLKAIADTGSTPLYILWNYISAELGTPSCPLKYRGRCLNVDAIIVRGLGRGLSIERYAVRRAILEAAESWGYVVVNPPEGLFRARDKFTSLRILQEAGIPVPRTLVTEDPTTALHAVEQLGDVVFKPIIGSLGLGSFRVKDTDTAYHIINLLLTLNQPLYIQKYLEKPGNRDLRVFVVGDHVVAAMYRIAPRNSWKTNIAQGAKPVPATVRDEVAKAVIRAVKVLGLVYAGVDVIEYDENRYAVIEVNASPLWRGLQSATGVNPARYIVEKVLELVKK